MLLGAGMGRPGPGVPPQTGNHGVAGPSSREPAALGVSPDSSTCAVEVGRAGTPGQRVLEGVEEVPEHPGQDRVVVQADQEGHGEAAQPCGPRARSAPPSAARQTPLRTAHVCPLRRPRGPCCPPAGRHPAASPTGHPLSPAGQRPPSWAAVVLPQPQPASSWAFGQPKATRCGTGLHGNAGTLCGRAHLTGTQGTALPSAQPPQVP